MSARPSIPARIQVSVAIRQAKSWVQCPLCMVPLTSTDKRVLEHMVPRATRIALGLDPDAPEILAWVHKACADKKTNGSKATCADGDLHKIAKAKRLSKARAEHTAVVERVLVRPAGKIKGRGFNKSLRKRMNGQVEKRT